MSECNECGFESKEPEKWDSSFSAYHDVMCPKCGTTNVDTSDWLADDPEYGYGNDNSLSVSRSALDK